MAKDSAKTKTAAASQPADQVKRKSTRNSDTGASADSQALPQGQGSRPKRSTVSKDNQSEPTSRKRPAQANEQPPTTNTAEPGLELEGQPRAKKPKTKTSKQSDTVPTPVPAAIVKKSGGKKLKKATSQDAGQATKENIPPMPATTTSKSKKSNSSDRREQQLNAVDHAALEQRIKELEAENADHLRKVERLQRKTKRLDNRATVLASSTADAKTTHQIEEPETATYSLQVEMGLADDYKTYARVQRTVRDLSRRTLDFNLSWKNQDPIVLGDLYRAASDKEPFLRRFRQGWATGKLAQMYLRNSRSYHANIDIPESAVAVRRSKTTIKGAKEAGLPPPDLSHKKKPTPRGSIPAGSKLGKSSKSASLPASASTTVGKGKKSSAKASDPSTISQNAPSIPDFDEDEDLDKSDEDNETSDEDEDEVGRRGRRDEHSLGREDEDQDGEEEESLRDGQDADSSVPSSDGHAGRLSVLAEEAGYDEAWIEPPRTPTGIAVHRLPAEIWMTICEALRRLDLIDSMKQHKSGRALYPELLLVTTNKNRPDLIITARSIFQLSRTCRYLRKVTSPSLLKNIRLSPFYSISPNEPGYLSVIRQVKSLHLNGDQELRHVKGLAVAFSSRFSSGDGDTASKGELRNEIHGLLRRLPNLRHLTVIRLGLDAPLMQSIPTLSLEHLWLWGAETDERVANDSLTSMTEPALKLQSLVVRESLQRGVMSIPPNWISRLIGPTMQDLAVDGDVLNPTNLPNLPGLEFLEVSSGSRAARIGPSVLSMLSKTPNLKEVALELKAPPGYPSNTFPTHSHLQRIMCHSSWLRYLIPGSSVTTAKVLCDSRLDLQEFSEILHEGNVPLRNLSLTYTSVWPQGAWSPDDLEQVVRCFPELEIFRFRMQDPKVVSLQQAIFYISRLDKLRLISFGFPTARRDILDDAWQELKLREFLGRTKSRVLERITFVGKGEWKLEKTRVWNLWEEGAVVRSVSL